MNTQHNITDDIESVSNEARFYRNIFYQIRFMLKDEGVNINDIEGSSEPNQVLVERMVHGNGSYHYGAMQRIPEGSSNMSHYGQSKELSHYGNIQHLQMNIRN